MSTLGGCLLGLPLHAVAIRSWCRILVQVTINRRLRIGRDGHLPYSRTNYDKS